MHKAEAIFRALDPREKKAALELFWRSSPWTARQSDVASWLRWAEEGWRPRIAETRVCAAMLRHFDPQNPKTAIVGDWLANRQDRIWGRFGEFARRWRLADGVEASENIAFGLAAGDMTYLNDLARNFQASVALRGSGFLVAVIDSFARHSASRSDEQAWTAADDLLEQLGPRGLAGASGPKVLRGAAKIAMVSGLVEWAARLGTPFAVNKALDLSFRMAGDPRASMDDWLGLPKNIVAQVEKWLVKWTLATAFQIVAELGTDDPAMLERRREFWQSYFPYITRARLIGAQKAQRAAVHRGAPCCGLKTYLSDHCGLLMEMEGPHGKSVTVVELNNLAQTMFWPDGRSNRPGFDQILYDGSVLRANCDLLLSHLPTDAWPSKFADLIALHTDIPAP